MGDLHHQSVTLKQKTSARQRKLGTDDLMIDCSEEGRCLFVSATMQRMREIINAVSIDGGSVLVSGRTGSGKSIIAEAVCVLDKKRKGLVYEEICFRIDKEFLVQTIFGCEGGSDLREGFYNALALCSYLNG